MAHSNAGFGLKRSLDELWTIRRDREERWADLLNLLQGALAREEFERFSAEQCLAIKEVLADHLRPWTVDDDDIRTSLRIMRRAGLDPWRPISGKKGEE
jgi:hypothetical protein